MFEAGKDSLFFYCKGILGMADMTEDLHFDYCRFLEGKPPHRPWTRAMVSMFRGGLKSSIGTIGYTAHCSTYWPALHGLDHVTKLVEQRAENAELNHFDPIADLFRHSAQADFLWWLYGDYGPDEDMRRLPENFTGWNSSQIMFRRTNQLLAPTITYGGITSRYEGFHGNLILGDDLEGADSDKSVVPTDDAYRFVEKRAVPLLIDPSRDRILIIGTPHGDNPLVHRMKRKEERVRKKHNVRVWEIYWKPLLDGNDQSIWPQRFPPGVIAGLKMSPELWDTQYMLRRRMTGLAVFDMTKVRESFYQWEARNQLIGYRHKEWDVDKLDEFGYPTFVPEFRTIAVSSLRIFMHCDPKHKDRITDRKQPSQAAILLAGVAPDGHVFVLETWVGDCGLEEYAEKVYWYYRKWKPIRVTMEAIGAQTWFWDYARLLEKGKYMEVFSLPRNGEVDILPKLSNRLIEAEKKNERKEEWIISQLEPWFSFGHLHCHSSQENLLSQIESFPDPLGYLDLLDCLSQGPSLWPKGYPDSGELRERMREAYLHSMQRSDDDVVGYVRPWVM